MHGHGAMAGGSNAGVLEWFAGGANPYHTLWDCMAHDTLWVAITVALDLIVAGGYLLIAKHWWSNQKSLTDSPAKTAMGRMRNIFFFCGICGYVFIPIKMVWPAWRLYDCFMLVLAWFTWRYAWSARDLKVVYQELNRSQRLQHELDQSRAESRRKSFFLNAISHDLRSPLHGLTLSAEVASLCLDDDDPVNARAALHRVRSSALEAAELLNNFMELGRLDWGPDPLQLEPVELAKLLREVAKEMQIQADAKGLALRMSEVGCVPMRTDRLKFKRIISNLVGNAIKYTNHGSVTIELRPNGDGARIDVVDTGVGIAAEDLQHIFDEFYQVNNDARESSKGFGLGLAIARRLAELLGVSMSAESVVGRGSRFSLFIPVFVPDAPRADEPCDRLRPSRTSEPTAAVG